MFSYASVFWMFTTCKSVSIFLLSCSQKNHSLSSYLELIYLCANLQKSGVLLLRDCSYNHSSVCSSDERAFQCLYCISIMFLTFLLFTQFYSWQNCVNHYSTCFYGKLGLSSIRTSKIAWSRNYFSANGPSTHLHLTTLKRFVE